MPEGPEIHQAADRLDRALAGHVTEEVWFAFDRLQRWQRRLSGLKVRRVEARGKAMLVRFAGGLSIYSHNQLYGRWYVMPAGKTPRTGRQLRLALHNYTSSALLYSASEIEVLEDAALEQHPYLAKLGPDLLDSKVTARQLRARLDDRRFTRRSLGMLLLDQGFLGGVGNYLRSEILFVAGLDPSRRPADLDAAERSAFCKAALTITRRSYRTRGITNDAKIARRLKDAGRPRREYRHFVFGRDGKPCHRCETQVIKAEVAGRRLYACPTCQG